MGAACLLGKALRCGAHVKWLGLIWVIMLRSSGTIPWSHRPLSLKRVYAALSHLTGSVSRLEGRWSCSAGVWYWDILIYDQSSREGGLRVYKRATSKIDGVSFSRT